MAFTFFNVANSELTSEMTRALMASAEGLQHHPQDIFGDGFLADPVGLQAYAVLIFLRTIASAENQHGYLKSNAGPLSPADLAVKCHVTLDDFMMYVQRLIKSGYLEFTANGYYIVRWDVDQSGREAKIAKNTEQKGNDREAAAIEDKCGEIKITDTDAIADVITHYNSAIGTSWKTTNKSASKLIQHRLNCGATAEEIKKVITWANDTWTGDYRNNLGLKTLISDKNYGKYVEDANSYTPNAKKKEKEKKKGPENTSFNDFSQREYDYADLEAQLIKRGAR